MHLLGVVGLLPERPFLFGQQEEKVDEPGTGGDLEMTLLTIVSDNYFPLLGIEAAGEPTPLLPSVKHEMRAVAPGYAQLSVNTLRGHLQDALYEDWLQAVLSITLALVGVGLAAVGLVGVVSHSVTRRSREIGIRTAIGAQRRDVVLMVLKQGLVLSGVGAALGVGLSLLVGQAMSSLLFGVSPSDPIVIGLSATVVIVIGLMGSAYPAWKASRVDPVQALRGE